MMMHRLILFVTIIAFAFVGCGGEAPAENDDPAENTNNVDPDAGTDPDAEHLDTNPDDPDAGTDPDADPDDPDADPDEGCEPHTPSLTTITVPFPSGDRQHEVPTVEHSFGDCPPLSDANLPSGYQPQAGECSVATHDRFWVRAQDGHVYRTWHPPSTIDVVTGEPCNFGHEHGDDPRESPLYLWASGVPFGIVNHIADAQGHHRHEDHFGHKVYAQNLYEVAIGNGPSEDPLQSAGFHCYWLSKVHQGTNSGDAIRHNMHEYQNNIMCDDGFARHPDEGWDNNTGPAHHTEASVKTLSFWGRPGSIEACSSRTPTPTSTDPLQYGPMPPDSADTNREILCALSSEGWAYKELPREIISETGHVDFEPRDAGMSEIWKPWMTVHRRNGQEIFLSSAYYGVRDSIRVFNDGSQVPQRDVNGDGFDDDWLPTLEACLAFGFTDRICGEIPTFPASVPQNDWWLQIESPFRGVIRFVHPKGITVANRSDRSTFCTDHLGQETEDDPAPDVQGIDRCPNGQLLQRVAATQNMWWGRASWGDEMGRGGIQASMVNARGSIAAGFGHEWVRFADAPGIRAPN